MPYDKSPLGTTKPSSDLFRAPCASHGNLFPSDIHPSEWQSCHDSYDYTWQIDHHDDLSGLSELDRLKLRRSTGFCPQNRCQLSSVANADFNGTCPAGLCYTKVENGSLSFGACCFTNGEFNSGEILGYYRKCQPTPKPIYKKTRIVLGRSDGGDEDDDDVSYDSFISANFVHKGLIATQCPLSGRPQGYANTVDDAKRMIIEQNISYWVQLAPNNISDFYPDGRYTIGKGSCGVFPLEFLSDAESPYSKGVTDFRMLTDHKSLASQPYVELSYTLTAYVKVLPNGKKKTVFIEPKDESSLEASSSAVTNGRTTDTRATENSQSTTDTSSAPVEALTNSLVSGSGSSGSVKKGGWMKVVQHVNHVWYHHWEDFKIPPAQDEHVIRELAVRAASTVRAGGTVAVNCLSGRGRTGTFIGVILGELDSINTHSDLVDHIVDLRRRRDGLVETPAQFRFIARVIGLSDTSQCGASCRLKQISDHTSSSVFFIPFLIGFMSMALLVSMFFLWRKRLASPRLSSKLSTARKYYPVSREEGRVELRPQSSASSSSAGTYAVNIEDKIGSAAVAAQHVSARGGGRSSSKQQQQSQGYYSTTEIGGSTTSSTTAGSYSDGSGISSMARDDHNSSNLDSQSTENEDRKTL